nr:MULTISPECIES: hypothetical protein [unclassified Streptomyces]
METFTGLRMRRLKGLVRVVRERGGNGPGNRADAHMHNLARTA